MKSPMNTLAADNMQPVVKQYNYTRKLFIQQVLCKLAVCSEFVTTTRNSTLPGPAVSNAFAELPPPEERHVSQSQISPSRNGQTDPDLRNRLRNAGVRPPQRSSPSGRSADRQASSVRQVREAGSPSPKIRPHPAYSGLAARPSSLASQQFNLASTHEGMGLLWLHVGAGHVADSPLSQTVPGESVFVSVPSPAFPQQEIQERL